MDILKTNLVISLMFLLLYKMAGSNTVQLTSSNIDSILANNELVFVNFYADWCRFSQMLGPVFDDASKKIKEEFPQEGRVILGKVDCDKETSIASKYHVTKYPTLKVFRFGNLIKREYRGQRSVTALNDFVKQQLVDPIQRFETVDELDNIENKKGSIIGYFDTDQGADYAAFTKLASQLRDDCKFYSIVGPASETERIHGNRIVFRSQAAESDIPYNSRITEEMHFQIWSQDKCVPLVREITFENAEELTEEGLPFLILFHNQDDKETPELFKEIVSKDLITEKNTVNCLTADGAKFSHPLYHLGKTAKDLPILAIDSFRHMYLWPHNVKTDLDKPNILKQFVADLHSGKLHREFHHGPDKTTPSAKIEVGKEKHIPHGTDDTDQAKDPTSPPESTFAKLAPSKSRYTILKDEL